MNEETTTRVTNCEKEENISRINDKTEETTLKLK